MIVATMLTRRIETRVIISNCLSPSVFFVNGLMRFSEKITEGARMDELHVLRIADNNDPKNKICIGSAVCANTIFGNASCASSPTVSGYNWRVQRLMNKGNAAIVM